ncbi:MAG: ribosomal protein S12 methylthiotransferase RimO [Epulopiscium sp. Nuni2H_MBin001]|nr:MAG: ribosomal protein S12 methylthiotransferase RimO [Epulopiscium sp. Nuni2H_MBin001]
MTVAFVSLGCDKNLVDSEHMLGLLHKAGFSLISDEAAAEVLVVNTCCFIEDAKQESIEQILDVAEYKKIGNCKALIVTGCMAQRYKEEILTEMPEVDAVIGTTSYDKIAEVAKQILEVKGVAIQQFEEINKPHLEEMPRILTTPGYFAYVKIAEGCDNKCTYCVIPSLRGKFRSRPQIQILKEVQKLAKDGVAEIILVAQDTTMYGHDLNNNESLAKLIHELSKIEGIQWIRILYCYPENITDELIEQIRTNDKVCKYLDMPIQHCADSILKRMARKSSNKQLRETITKLRTAVPNIALRTTLIVGFPGETKQDFKELCDFVADIKFDRLGVFTYSQEEGTPAANMPNQIDEETKQEREEIIMEIQSEVVSQLAHDKINTVMTVVVDYKLADEDVYSCRTYQDAPDVDSEVFIDYEGELLSGDFINVKIKNSVGYYLTGEVIEKIL